MRVISGTARGKKLTPVPGMDTRPTTDRVKESIFNIIQNHVRGARVLDLFAGTGQMGIEALSRGAARARISTPAACPTAPASQAATSARSYPAAPRDSMISSFSTRPTAARS